MLCDVRYEPAGDVLIPLLSDEHARVRYFAAEALGRIGYQEAVQPIVEMLEANNDEDVYLRHGGAIALARIGDSERSEERRVGKSGEPGGRGTHKNNGDSEKRSKAI